MSAIYGDPLLESFFRYPATSLGIAIELRPSTAPRLDVISYISVHSARSLTGQAAVWRPVRHHLYRGRLISRPVDSSLNYVLQERVLKDISQTIGSALFRFDESGELIDITPGVQRESMWTLDRCDTSQFENEIRAHLDLPLGLVTSLDDWMAAEFDAPSHLDMIHPFRHLFARRPEMKFHRFEINGSNRGCFTLRGDSSLEEEMYHVVDYLEGVIDE